jgi:hypothetical protein
MKTSTLTPELEGEFTPKVNTLSPELLRKMDAYWRAANYRFISTIIRCSSGLWLWRM